ncbi:MAG: alpha/beta hydrolase, partial [Rhodopila sp.]
MPQSPTPPDQADPTVVYDLYIGTMIQQSGPSKTAAQLVTARALPLLEEARTTCVGQMFRDVVQAGLNQGNALAAGFVPALPSMEYSTVHLPAPLFVGTGERDHDVPPAEQLALVRNACA